MAKEVTLLALEGGFLRGVRLEEDGEALERTAEEVWPLAPEASAEEAAAPDAEAEEPLSRADRLADALTEAAEAFDTREFALSVPLSQLLVRTVRVELEARDNLLEAAAEALKGISPFPDEPLTPSAEILAETDRALVVLAAALPDAASAEISEALAAAKVRVTRTDATALGWLRTLWPALNAGEAARRIVLMDLDDGWDLVVLDAGALVYARGLGAVASPAELAREVTLSLLQVDGEPAAGAVEVAVCSRAAPAPDVAAALAPFGAVRAIPVEDAFGGAEGAARRLAEDATLDFTPAAWHEDLVETRFQRSFARGLAVALGLWALVMGALFGVDSVYGFLKTRQENLMKVKAHKVAFKEVEDMTNRVALIERYADHAHGALEILKQVSDALPEAEDMTLDKFHYVRGESVHLVGTAGAREDVRTFTENLQAATFEDDDVRIFSDVKQSGGETLNKKNVVKFTLDGLFPKAEPEDDGKKGWK